MPTYKDRLAGGLIGLLVGDALGVPYEFHDAADIPPFEQIEYAPPNGYHRAHMGTPPGTWSDDGALALCLLASLLACDAFDAEDFGRRVTRWSDEGYLAVDGRVFDMGIQTSRAIAALRAGTPALAAGSTAESALGNGSLMRALPLALWHAGPDAALVADAQAQSRVTHGHLRAQVCCALYCLWARYTLREHASPWPDAVAALRAHWPVGAPERAELDDAIQPDNLTPGRGGGYVVDCLRSARWATDQGGYEQTVKAAIGLGRDTDTTACVAGGIAGLRDGVDAIPSRWRVELRGQELYQPLLDELLTQRG